MVLGSWTDTLAKMSREGFLAWNDADAILINGFDNSHKPYLMMTGIKRVMDH